MKIELDPFEELQELTQRLNYYRDAYYNKDFSIISDEEYDKLYDRLLELENLVGVKMENSPTQSVGYEVVSELPTVKHNHPLLSLDKTKLSEDIVKFANNHPVLIMPKMDGLTCTLRYIDGKLNSAITRGNGEEGELITHNARAMKSIPDEIDTLMHEVIIDGELMITYKDFNRVNQELLDADVPENELFANPRSMAAGTARQLDSSVCVHRNLKFVAWRCYKGPDTDAFNIRLKWLERMGFETVEWIYDNKLDVNSFERYVKIIELWAKDNDYKIDGCVIGYNSIAYGESLGHTKHHPRNQIAFKFYDDKFETILRDIEWSVGKTGAITPVAIFDPVEIDGTIVKRASMHNLTIMKNLNASIGKVCYVYKANMIIPQIESFDSNECDIIIPDTCPICGKPTYISESIHGQSLICCNDFCKGKMLGRFETFVSKPAMNIDGFSSASIELFWDKGWLRSFADIYEMRFINRLAYLEGWGAKSIKKLSEAIDRSRKVMLDKFITALSIPNIAGATATVIAEACDWDIMIFLDRLIDKYEWSELNGIGFKTSLDINHWYPDHKFEIASLLDHLEFIKPEKKEVIESEWSGKTFCITGTFGWGPREEIKEKLEELGMKNVSGVSKNTNILFAGEKCGSKLKKAQDLGIIIYNEDKLMEILHD